MILAIPTWGLSLVVFFLAKSWLDKKAANAIIGAMATSLRTVDGVNLYHINRAAVRRAIETVGIEIREPAHTKQGISFYPALGIHPMLNNGEPFSFYIYYEPRRGTRNTIEVFAAPGESENILSIADRARLTAPS